MGCWDLRAFFKGLANECPIKKLKNVQIITSVHLAKSVTKNYVLLPNGHLV